MRRAQVGDKQPHPFSSDRMIALDVSELDGKLYPLTISSFVPRPIAFVCSLSEDGESAPGASAKLRHQP